jgi:hypothetical protein
VIICHIHVLIIVGFLGSAKAHVCINVVARGTEHLVLGIWTGD